MDYFEIINFVHLLFTGPFLIYIGLMKPSNKIYYMILLLLSLIYTIIFLYKAITNQLYIWMYVHFFLFVPLLLYIAYTQVRNIKIDGQFFSFLLAIGLAAFGYFIIKIYKMYVLGIK
jgi:hypothetical protein